MAVGVTRTRATEVVSILSTQTGTVSGLSLHLPLALLTPLSVRGKTRADGDSESDDAAGAAGSAFYRGQYGPPSSESLMNAPPGGPFRGYPSRSGTSTPSVNDFQLPPQYLRLREPYPSWASDNQAPLSKEEIEDIFIDLANKFGFQRDSMRNMYDHLMIQLDSRSSRMPPAQALLTLHADYIGGEHANYRKWYFAAQLDLDDAIGNAQNSVAGRLVRAASKRAGGRPPVPTASARNLGSAQTRWRQAMANMSAYDRLRQIALYLLCWGEASQVRYCPECLCFIFKCADDYYRSPECQNRIDPVPEGLYLRAVIRPIYRFLRDQGYEIIDNAFVKRERDHDRVIGYDDVNQLFWYPEGINRIVLQDRTRLVDVPPAQRYMKFDKIEWPRAFMKTYYESRSFLHLLVNFNRIWVLHISFYWYYTAYNCEFRVPALPRGARTHFYRQLRGSTRGRIRTSGIPLRRCNGRLSRSVVPCRRSS
jgi:1,3-beta-glucan synthase